MSQEDTYGNATRIGANKWTTGFGNGIKTRVIAEGHSYEIEAVGDFETLLGVQPKVGNTVAPNEELCGVKITANGLSDVTTFGVKNSTISTDGGGVATLRVSLVGMQGLSGPYDETWDIDMQEVQMSLKRHPAVTASDVSVIQLWEATPEAKRITTSDDGATITFKYYAPTGAEEDQADMELKEVDSSSMAYNVLYAMMSGIETYNIYLPVVTRTTHWLKEPFSDEYSALGTFSDPDKIPRGYKKGQFFKSGDKVTVANDGSITRVEQWTYTNDMTHKWIYEEVKSSS